MNQVQLEADNIKPNDNEEDKADPDFEDMPWDAAGCKERMEIVNQYVSEVSILPVSSREHVNIVLNLKLIFSYSGCYHFPQTRVHKLVCIHRLHVRSRLGSRRRPLGRG